MSASVVLQSWKEISAYVGRTERTLQRWETKFGFPVHRPSSKSRSAVMALPQEINEWTRGKPSLVSIREGCRLKAAPPPDQSQRISEARQLESSSNTTLPSHSHQLRKTNVLKCAVLEQLQRSRSLWDEQVNLRADIRDLLTTQRKLHEKLSQILLEGQVT